MRVTGHEVWVDVGGRTVPCLLRGRFRKKGPNFQVVAGDRVEVTLPGSAGGPGNIETVHERTSWLSRYVGGRVSAERVIVANIDKLVVVVSVRDPRLRFGFIDRVLVSAERGHTESCLCLNKIDAIDGDEVTDFMAIYSAIGYPIIRTSAKTGEGVDELAALFKGGVYAFVGQSGVGKSSLLNEIDPNLQLKVADVARKTGGGRHTTTYSQLFPIRGGYMADTPGMQTFGFPGTAKEELTDCFAEYRAYAPQCRFQPCTHSHEPECAVKAALEASKIHESRYRSYLEMLAEVEQPSKSKYS